MAWLGAGTRSGAGPLSRRAFNQTLPNLEELNLKPVSASNRGKWAMSLVGIVLLLWTTAKVGAQVETAREAARDVIRVGVLEDFPPHYETQAVTGEPRGFAIDTFKAVAQISGIRYRFVVYDNWSEALNAFRAGDIDLIPNLGVTEERQSYARFTAPLETVGVRAFIRTSNHTIKNTAHLRKKVVAVVDGNVGPAVAAQFTDFPESFDSLQDALLAMLAGKVEALIYPQSSVERLLRESGLEHRVRPVGKPLYEVKRAMAVRPDQEQLFQQIDSGVRSLLEKEQFAQLYERWYREPAAPFTFTSVIVLAASIVGLTVLFLFWRQRTLLSMKRRIEELKARQREQLLEAQSTEMAAKLRVFFDQSLSFAGIMELDGIVTEANRTSLETCGYGREEVIGKYFWQTPWWRGSVDVQNAIRDAVIVAAGGGVVRMELDYWMADGSQRVVDFALAPVRNDAGEIIFLAPTAQDITERKQAEMALEHARQLAENASQAKSKFVANMSHELRTPLSAILGYTEILAMHLREPDNLVNVEAIRRNGEHLLALLNDVLDLSRIEAGKLSIFPQQFSLVAFVSDIFALLENRAHAKDIPLRVEYQGKVPEIIESDPMRLKQILINLVGNAIKFTEKGSVEVIIRAIRKSADCVDIEFSIRDTGVGIPHEQLKLIFDAFEQGDTSITRRFEGSGLGLNISQRLARLLDGSITVESEVQRGSTFTFTFPAVIAPSAEFIEPLKHHLLRTEPPKPYRRLNGELILVVDDRDDMRLLIQRLIEQAGGKSRTAVNGKDALEQYEKSIRAGESFDVIVMDMQMPVMDGFKATTLLREAGYRKTIVALTAGAMQGEREKCLAAGCNHYLSKPVDGRQLLEMLASAAMTPDLNEVPGADVAIAEKFSVLIVDDNADAQNALSQILQLEGFVTHTASTGRSAIDCAQTQRPGAVILDINLPDMSGYDVLAVLRSTAGIEHTRFIGLSGEEAGEAATKKFDSYFTKPADLVRLKALLSSWRFDQARKFPDAAGEI